jgi:hypothetical protein
MAHWEFLTEKLGSDVVKYIIQPMLLSSKADMIEIKHSLSEWFLCRYSFLTFNDLVRPSLVRQHEISFECWGCYQRRVLIEITKCKCCGLEIMCCHRSCKDYDIVVCIACWNENQVFRYQPKRREWPFKKICHPGQWPSFRFG